MSAAEASRGGEGSSSSARGNRGRGSSRGHGRGAGTRGGGGGGNRGGRGRGGGGAAGRRGNFGGSITRDGAEANTASHSTAASTSQLASPPSAPAADQSQEGTCSQAGGGEGTTAAPPPAQAAPEQAVADDDDEEELCLICAEPIKLFSVGVCNHRTCHICAIRLRALYRVRECTLCKTTLGRLVFTTSPDKVFGNFAPSELPYSDGKLDISFETREAHEDTLILLRFNCPDERCDVVSTGWADLKMHAKRDHDRVLCDLCIKNKKIFAHEHTLHTTASLAQHMRADHRFCEYCHTYFYSDEELYVHMRDRHEQCHICKASDNETERWKYYRDYAMLEQHFRQAHYLCPTRECLDKKFIVFESEMDFKAHQVAEHGADLSSKELKEAMRIEANFRYDDSNTAGPSSGGRGGAGGRKGKGGRRGREADPAPPSDPLGLSALALRANVPGAGPANHSRRIHFGGHTTSSDQAQRAAAESLAASADRSAAGGSASNATASASVQERHEAYLRRVASLLGGSESKLQSFRGSIKIFRAGEMSAPDLVDTIHALVGDLDDAAVAVNGLADLLDAPSDKDKKEAILKAWNKLRLERTQFPSLVPVAGGAPGGSAVGLGAAHGWTSMRNVKSRSSSNNQIWANVERAAAGGGGGIPPNWTSSRSALSTTAPSRSGANFPKLGQASNFSTNAKTSAPTVPGSAAHAARANAGIRNIHGSTPWSQASSSTRVLPPEAPSPPVPYASNHYPSSHPATTAASKASSTGNKTAPKHTSTSAFPSLPTNASAAALAAQKRALFAHKNNHSSTHGSTTPNGNRNGYALSNGGSGTSGSATPSGHHGSATGAAPWYLSTSTSSTDGRSSAGRIDGLSSPNDYDDEGITRGSRSGFDVDHLSHRLNSQTSLDVQPPPSSAPSTASGQGQKGKGKGKKGVSVLSMGGVHRGQA